MFQVKQHGNVTSFETFMLLMDIFQDAGLTRNGADQNSVHKVKTLIYYIV